MADTIGRFSDGRTAASREVTLTIEGDGLAIRGHGALLALWPLASVRLIEKPASDGTARLCRLGGGERLTFQGVDFLAALRTAAPGLAGSPYSPTPWRAVVGWLSIAIAGLTALFLFALPHFAELIASHLSPALEQRMGRWLVAPVSDQLRLMQPGKGAQKFCPATGTDLQWLANRLASGGDLKYRIHVQVVNSAMINAFALPGGELVVLRGLIDFAETPNELAGVLAHEIAHEDLHHPTRLVIERGTAGFLVGLVFGDVIGASALGGLAGAVLGASYGREAEAEADARGLALLSRAGIDGAAWADLFDRLSRKEPHGVGAFSLLESHPPTPERAALIRQASHGGGEALGLAEWRAIKEICD